MHNRKPKQDRNFSALSHPLERQLFEIIYNKSLDDVARKTKLIATLDAIKKVRELILSCSKDVSAQPATQDFSPSINVIDPETGNTALIAAAAEGHLTSVETLRDYGVDHTIRNKDGNTALIETIYHDTQHCQSALLAIPGFVEMPEEGYEGRSPILIAIAYADSTSIRQLTPSADLTKPIQPYRLNPVAAAAKNGSLPLLKFLIESKKENGIEDVLNVAPESLYSLHYENTLVRYICYGDYHCGYLKGLTYAPTHQEMMTYATALREALENEHFDCARYLLAEVYNKESRQHIMKLFSYEMRRPEYSEFTIDGTFLVIFRAFGKMHKQLSILMANDCGLPKKFYNQSMLEDIYADTLCITINLMVQNKINTDKAIKRLKEDASQYPEAHRLLAEIYEGQSDPELAIQHYNLAIAGGDLLARKQLAKLKHEPEIKNESPSLEEKTSVTTVSFFSRDYFNRLYNGRKQETIFYGVPYRNPTEADLDAMDEFRFEP